MLLDWKNQCFLDDCTIQGNLQIQYNPYQVTRDIIHRTRTEYFKICMEMQKTLKSQSNVESNNSNNNNPEMEDSGSLTSDNITKLQLSKQHGTGTKSEIEINGTG